MVITTSFVNGMVYPGMFNKSKISLFKTFYLQGDTAACEITRDDMQFPSAKRISYPQRSLESILAAGGDRKKFKDYYNCVAEGMFDIPLSHVYLYSTSTIKLTTSLFSLRVLGMPTWTPHHSRHLHKDI